MPRTSSNVRTAAITVGCLLLSVAALHRPVLARSAAARSASASSAKHRPSTEAKRLAALSAQLRRAADNAAALGPLLSIAELRGLLPPRALFRVVAATAARWGRKADRLDVPAVVLRGLLAELDAELNMPSARRWAALPGAVTSWSWLGPLADGAGTAFDRVDSELEHSTVRASQVAGRDGPVHWRPVPVELAPPLKLAELVQRPAAAIVYVETWLRLREAATIRIAMTVRGRARLFIDGVLRAECKTGAAAGDPGRAVPAPEIAVVRLQAGWHALRLKLSDPSGELPLSVRLGRADGEPMVFEHRATAPEIAAVPAIAVAAVAAVPVKATSKLVARAQKDGAVSGVAPGSGLLALAAMRRHGWAAAAGEDVSALLAKNKDRSVDVGLAWALTPPAPGDMIARLRLLQQPSERVMVAHATALVELDRAAAAHRLYVRWVKAGRQRADGKSIAACAQRVDLWLQLGADLAAWLQAKRCAKSWPQSPAALDVLARVALARDHAQLADDTHRRLWTLHPGSARRYLELVGPRSLADPLLKGVPAPAGLPPAFRRGLQYVARSWLQHGAAEKAAAALTALPKWQWRATTWALMGRAQAQLNKRERAVHHLRKALRLSPGRDDYRARLRRLAPGSRFYQPYRRDLIALARSAVATTVPIETILSQTAVRHDGSRQARYEAEVIAIGAGGPREHEIEIEYVPSQSAVEVLQAAVVKRDGRVLRRVKRDLNSLSEGWYGLYYDLERLTLRYSGLEPGDTIIIEHVVRDFAADPFGMVFGELLLLGDARPVRRVDIAVELPAGTRLASSAWQPMGGSALASQLQKGSDRKDGKRRFSTWRMRAGPFAAVAIEPAMPGATEVVPYLHMSSFQSSAAVAKWYAQLIQQALGGARTDPAIAALARKLGAGHAPKEQVERVFRYVSDHIRYVGLEFGIHSLRPHDAPLVLARRFGDCKDKATLIVALLQHLGIDAQVALVRTPGNGRITDPIASLGIFDHAIAWVPSQKLWLDATQQHHLPVELPALDAGGMALRIPLTVGHVAGEIELLPRAPAAANSSDDRRVITVAADGSAELAATIALSGMPAVAARRRLHADATRRERVEADLSAYLPGTRVRSVKVKGLAPAAAVELAVVASVPEYAPLQRGLARAERAVSPFAASKSLSERLGAPPDRAHDLLLPFAYTMQRQVRLEVPAGWRPLALAERATIEDPLLDMSVHCQRDGPAVVCRARLVAKVQRIAARDVARWRRLLARADSALAVRVRFAVPGASRK